MTDPNVKNVSIPNQWDENEAASEAEAWLVRLTLADASKADKAAFAQWRLEDTRHAQAYDRAQKLWARSGDMLEELSADPELEAMLAEARQPAAKARWRRHLSVAACFAATVTVLAWLLKGAIWPSLESEIYQTAIGERRLVTLADNSQVLLDAATRLEVALGETRRQLVLVKGQARFTVAPDANRPFTVGAAKGSVTALGTVFDVHTVSQGVSVTLIEGAVEVKNRGEHQPEARMLLQPGQRVDLLEEGNLTEPERVDTRQATEWTLGRLVFQNEPLSAVVEELNRHSPRKIVIGDEVDDYKLRGTFNADNPEAVIEAMAQLFPIKIVEERDVVLLARDREL